MTLRGKIKLAIGIHCFVIGCLLFSAVWTVAERPWYALAQLGIVAIILELVSRNVRMLR